MSKELDDVTTTLNSIDRATGPGDFHWTDPEFLKWEREQIKQYPAIDTVTFEKIEPEILVDDIYEYHDREENLRVRRWRPGYRTTYSTHVRPMVWPCEDGGGGEFEFLSADYAEETETDPVFGYRIRTENDNIGERLRRTVKSRKMAYLCDEDYVPLLSLTECTVLVADPRVSWVRGFIPKLALENLENRNVTMFRTKDELFHVENVVVQSDIEEYSVHSSVHVDVYINPLGFQL